MPECRSGEGPVPGAGRGVRGAGLIVERHWWLPSSVAVEQALAVLVRGDHVVLGLGEALKS